MVFERTGNHHAALTRHVPLGPINDVSRFARRDPMRLPDLHLRQAVATAGTGSQERERLNFGERGLDEPEVRRFDANGQPESAVDLPPRPARNTRKQHETTAREYIERSRAGARQYQEPVRRPSPQRVSTRYISESEHIERRDPRPPVVVKRASGRTHESKLFGRPAPVIPQGHTTGHGDMSTHQEHPTRKTRTCHQSLCHVRGALGFFAKQCPATRLPVKMRKFRLL
jgi:hypothetical protein